MAKESSHKEAVLNMRLPVDLLEQAKANAKSKGVSLAKHVRTLLEEGPDSECQKQLRTLQQNFDQLQQDYDVVLTALERTRRLNALLNNDLDNPKQ